MTAPRRRRPEEKRSSVLAAAATTAPKNKMHDVRKTSLKIVTEEEKDLSGGTTGGFLTPRLFAPTDEQLEKINKFTLREVDADDVVCFTTDSCNDLQDRDDDRFRTRAVKGFASLPYPYSPTGKSYMVSHDHAQLGIGRIFDTGTRSAKMQVGDEKKSVTFLTNDVYIPRIKANETFIQNLEFGVNWAVSVGVLFGKAECSIGKVHDWGWAPWFCSEGHEKGLWYDPNSDEEDSWGWPMPVSAGAHGATQAVCEMDDAKDMYELSQVYLGAQYMAELAKDPALAPVMKVAKSFPVIGLRDREKAPLRVPELPDAAREAAKNHNVKENEGTFSWKDAEGLQWSYTPGEDSAPLLMGRAEEYVDLSEIKAKRDELKGKCETLKTAEGAAALLPQLEGLINQIDDALDNSDLDTANPLVDQAQDLVAQMFDEFYEDGSTDDPDDDPGAGSDDKSADGEKAAGHSHYHEHSDGQGHSHKHTHSNGEYGHGADDLEVTHAHTHENDNKSAKDDAMSKKAVLAAMQGVTLPHHIYEAVQEAGDGEALKVLLRTASATLSENKEMADAGKAYIKSLGAECLEWFRRKEIDPRSPHPKGVDVSRAQKLVELAGNDVEMLKALRDDYKSIAEERWPKAVRRSSFEQDANSPQGEEVRDRVGDIEERIDTASVSRIHG